MRTKLVSIIAGAALVLSLTTACQADSPDITSAKAEQLQSRVLAVTTAVSDGSLAKALELLIALEAELKAAAADGTVSKERQEQIEAAIAVVRADIQAAIDALAEPEPEPEPAPSPVETVTPDDDADEPDTETKDEKKAREAAEKAIEDAAKKAEDERKKAEEEAKKQAEDEAKKGEETPPATETPGSDG